MRGYKKMKKIGIAALVFAAIFVVTVAIGGILLVTQIATITDEDISRLEAAVENLVDDIDISVSGVNVVEPIGIEDFSTGVDLSGKDIPNIIELCGTNMSNFKVTIERSASDELVVEYHGESCYDPPVEIVLSNDRASIEFGGATAYYNIDGSAHAAEATVLLPASFNGVLRIENATGEYLLIADVDALELDNFCGELEASCAIGGIMIDNCAGEIEIKNTVCFTQDSYVENCAGEIEINLPLGSALNIETTNSISSVIIDGVLQSSDAAKLYITNSVGEIEIKAE